jgi:hypothetical protein
VGGQLFELLVTPFGSILIASKSIGCCGKILTEMSCHGENLVAKADRQSHS